MRKIIRALFLIVYMVLSLLFLIGFMSAYLHPHHFWWTALVAVLLPYVSLALILLLPVAIWLRRLVIIVLQVPLLALMAIRFIELGPSDSHAPASDEDLVLMTFNVPFREASPRDPDPAHSLMDLIESEDADLISIQDVRVWLDGPPDRIQLDAHLKGLVDELDYHITRPAGYGQRHYIKNAVLSRLSPEEQSRTTLTNQDDNGVVTYITRKRFRWQGRPFVHYNLHLRSFGDPKPWRRDWTLHPDFWKPYLSMYRQAYRARAWEVEQIKEMIARETDSVIITGDLNSTPHNWEYRQLAKGMQDAFKVAGTGWGATYHSRMPLVRIDYLLVGPEWEIVSAHVPKVQLSDHRPVVARIRWRAGE